MVLVVMNRLFHTSSKDVCRLEYEMVHVTQMNYCPIVPSEPPAEPPAEPHNGSR